MSDKTISHDADDYKDDDASKNTDTSHIDNDELVDRAESDNGQIPNRDEDEFAKRHLKEPEIDIETEEQINRNSDER